MIELDRVKRVRSLVSLGDVMGSDIMETKFESLGNQVHLLAMMFNSTSKYEKEGGHFRSLAVLFRSVNFRLTDVFFRLSALELMRHEYAQISESERIADLIGPADHGDRWMWHMLIELAIKDFHADINSLMDSVAPLIISMNQELRDPNWVPGFSQIRKDRWKEFRKQIPEQIKAIIDKTDSWWPEIQKVRDILIHHEHYRIVFPSLGYDDSLLFQVYQGIGRPTILRPELKYPDGVNVIDFSLYSGFVLAGVLAFFEDLAEEISLQLKIGSTTPSLRQNNFRPLASSLDRLASLYENV